MSRNASIQCIIFALLGWLLPAGAQEPVPAHAPHSGARIVAVKGDHLMDAYLPDATRLEAVFNRGLTFFTGQTTVSNAWRSLVATNDIVGIKVFSAPGRISGTRPAVVAVIVRGLLAAGQAASNIVIWDRYASDLRTAGYYELGKTLGVRVTAAADAGYDTNAFYLPDSPVVGQLVWGDREFGLTNKDGGVGKKSFLSKLVSRQMTKIISVAPLMNEYAAGICGHFFSLGLGSIENTRRFEGNPDRLAVALPEIYALPLIGDRVVLQVTDALLAQCQGGPAGYLQFSVVRNEIWFARDPVALDVMGIKELMLQRRLLDMPRMPSNFTIYTNAVLLQLGVDDPSRIKIEQVK